MPLLLTYDEAASRLNTSKRTVERLVADGAIPAKRLGRRTYVTPDALDAYVADLPDERTA